jgi:hypothetical protein
MKDSASLQTWAAMKMSYNYGRVFRGGSCMPTWVFTVAAWVYAALCAAAALLIGYDTRFFIVAVGCALNSLLNGWLSHRLSKKK